MNAIVAVNLVEALKKTVVIEIDGVFVGKNWNLVDDSDADIAGRALMANYVDDTTFEAFDWNLGFTDLAGAVYLPSEGMWELVVNGEPFTLRVYALNPITAGE